MQQPGASCCWTLNPRDRTLIAAPKPQRDKASPATPWLSESRMLSFPPPCPPHCVVPHCWAPPSAPSHYSFHTPMLRGPPSPITVLPRPIPLTSLSSLCAPPLLLLPFHSLGVCAPAFLVSSWHSILWRASMIPLKSGRWAGSLPGRNKGMQLQCCCTIVY